MSIKADFKDIVCATNNAATLSRDLGASPDVIAGTLQVLAQSGYECAGKAYNAGLDHACSPVVAFIHQDVYLPRGWMASVSESLRLLALRDPEWAVLGVWGIRADGLYAGRVWCSGGGKEHVGVTDGTQQVASVDEIVIIVNGKHGLRFDEQLPGFHLYATNIILAAAERGLKSYVIQAPVVHNSRRNPQPLDKHYFAAYRYMQRKWSGRLPLQTAVVPVTRSGWPLYRQWARNELRKWRGKVKAAPPRDDPKAIAVELGYEARSA